MTEKRTDLSSRVQRALALDGPPFGRPRLLTEEIDGIHALLSEGPSAAARVNLKRAMFVAADNAPTAETAALIARILENKSADPALRYQAAATLGEIPVRAASEALVKSLPGSSAVLEFTLLSALAKIGHREAAQAIAARPRSQSARLMRMREFARASILYRNGVADARAEAALFPAGTAVAIAHQPASEVGAVIRRLRGSTYGLTFNDELGYEFRCGEVRHLFLLSSELQRGKLLDALQSGRRLAGLVVMEDVRGTGQYIAHRLIATRPEREGVAVSIIRPMGDVTMRGFLRPKRPKDKGFELQLYDHGGERVPTEISGLVTNDGLELSARVFLENSRAKGHGELDPTD